MPATPHCPRRKRCEYPSRRPATNQQGSTGFNRLLLIKKHRVYRCFLISREPGSNRSSLRQVRIRTHASEISGLNAFLIVLFGLEFRINSREHFDEPQDFFRPNTCVAKRKDFSKLFPVETDELMDIIVGKKHGSKSWFSTFDLPV